MRQISVRNKKILLTLALIGAAMAAISFCVIVAYYIDLNPPLNAVLLSIARPLAMTGCALAYFVLCCRIERTPALTLLPLAAYYCATACFAFFFRRSVNVINVTKYAVFFLFLLFGLLTMRGLLKGVWRLLTLLTGLGSMGLRIYILVAAGMSVARMGATPDVPARVVAANVMALLPYLAELLLLAAMILSVFFVRREGESAA